ncbi:MAG TPA: hypothetical protein PLO37_08395 [Candidatus Hydrogenedentes bacterium]|nr:hypothetical protein [Candidatus Hydrogenedentota bacterium]HPG66851.1 hypothetical protein [Candidatus Hydrogenedentota bacterium]
MEHRSRYRWLWILLAVSIVGVTSLGADRDVSWFRKHMTASTEKLPEGVTVTVEKGNAVEGRACFRVEYTGYVPVSIPLLEMQDPRPEDRRLICEAQLRSKDLKAPAYIEMLCTFPQGVYFGRGLNESLTGTQDWQRATTSFFYGPKDLPSRVQVGVRMEGAGTVWVDNIRMHPLSPWGLGPGGAIGGYLGGALGILAGLWGAMTGVLSARGRGFRFIFVTGILLWVCSLGILGVGVAFLAMRQPSLLWYPWLLAGGIGTVLFASLLPVVVVQARRAEARKMAAMDLVDPACGN